MTKQTEFRWFTHEHKRLAVICGYTCLVLERTEDFAIVLRIRYGSELVFASFCKSTEEAILFSEKLCPALDSARYASATLRDSKQLREIIKSIQQGDHNEPLLIPR
jgi:hypothetical protein